MKIQTVSFDTTPKLNLMQGRPVKLDGQLIDDSQRILTPELLKNYRFQWTIWPNETDVHPDPLEPWKAQWVPTNVGEYEIHLTVKDAEPNAGTLPSEGIQFSRDVLVQASALRDSITVTLAPSGSSRTNDDALFQSIRESTAALDFEAYRTFIDNVMCHGPGAITDTRQRNTFQAVNRRRATVFPGIDAYQRLKVATEVYVMLSVRVLTDYTFAGFDPGLYKNKHGQTLTLADLQNQWQTYLKADHGALLLPIDQLIRAKLHEPIDPEHDHGVSVCQGLLQEKLRRPCFFELIWSYWHEEGMLVQTMKAIALRFQNKRTSEHDPLANLDVSPLHPLSNLLWGYIQEEQHRLTVPRRAYEYDHQYGLSLDGKAVPMLRSADSRSKFLEAFHNLLHGALLFYKQDDDTTKRADAFPVLNGLKEVHLLLREGMHNQFGDLPSAARIEMLMEQWILARPEMKEFLGGRAMLPYSEDWMDRVDTMKKLKGWTDVSITYFNELAEFGEKLLLSMRHGDWSNIHDATFAAHWAREWRPEIQQYIHAYRTVTGVDLTPQQADVRLSADRYLQPSVHLRKRLESQRHQTPSRAGFGSPRRADSAIPAGHAHNGNFVTDADRPNSRREALELSDEL